jgi:hypothetical protein
MKYWHPHLPFGQHISVSTLVSIIKKIPQTMYNSKCLTGHKFESVRTITTELPSLYISVLLFGINMQIYVASKVMSLLLICNNSDTLKNPAKIGIIPCLG